MKTAVRTIEDALFWVVMGFTAGVIVCAALAAFGVIR